MHQTLINAEVLQESLGKADIRIIDCRFSLADKESGRRDYEVSHIPGAIYAHLDDDLSGEIIPGTTGRHPMPSVADFAELCSTWGINEDTQVVAYDQGHGGIAARLWFMLQWLGHEKVAVLNGGWAHWEKMGLPVDSEIAVPERSEFQPASPKNSLVEAGDLLHLQQEDNWLLVDSRAAERYRGEKEPIDPVAGHIPGAVSAPFAGNLNSDGLFHDRAALEQRFDTLLGEQELSQTAFYCGSGVTACHNLLALHHIGRTEAKLYAGSWSDWITDTSRPIATGK